jgi:2,3-bisphosphoglycerate-dependent phosphoglycerate mutase
MIEPTRLFAVRHGRTAWNAEQRIQGHHDEPLDALGCWQAEQLAQALAGEALAAIYSSDLQRAAATAAPLAARLGVVVHRDPGLRERGFGLFEGITHAQIEQQWPEAARRWRERDPGFGPPGGERLADFYERSLATVLRLANRHAGQAVLVVTHGGVLDCLYRAATHASLQARRSWQLGNASINRLLYTPQGLTLVGWNDDAHLAASPEQISA